jgi:cysteine-rich secretory family protein
MRRVSLTLLAPAICAALAAAANAATPAQEIAALNKQRLSHGLPAGIVQNAEWSRRCALHVNWMIQNHTLAHQETPGSPGYTEDGNWAGTHSVISVGQPGFTKPTRNPYLNAPYHLAQLLDPQLKQMGVNERQSYNCSTTFPGYTRVHPPTDTFYSYPGPNRSIAWAQNAAEGPSVPGDSVGLPQGTTTGPNLIVWCFGPRNAPLTDIRSATLKRGDGTKVDIRIVDDRNGFPIPGSGFLIPVKPLKPGRTYTGKVTFSSQYAKRTFTKSWTFKTDKLRTGKAAVSIGIRHAKNNALYVSAQAHDQAYLGHKARLFADYGKGFDFQPVDMRIGQTTAVIPGPAKGRSVKLKLKVLSFKAGGTKTKAFTVKRTVKG